MKLEAKTTSHPNGVSLYIKTDLKITGAVPVTGIFIPSQFVGERELNLIVFLRGWQRCGDLNESVEEYWDAKRHHWSAFREGLNAAHRNVVLVVPNLGAKSEIGILGDPSFFNRFISDSLEAIFLYGGAYSNEQKPVIGKIALACHSGGGRGMRTIFKSQNKHTYGIDECWGFDSTYGGDDDAFWIKKVKDNKHLVCIFYFIEGSGTAKASKRMLKAGLTNLNVVSSVEKQHCFVLIAYWESTIAESEIF